MMSGENGKDIVVLRALNNVKDEMEGIEALPFHDSHGSFNGAGTTRVP